MQVFLHLFGRKGELAREEAAGLFDERPRVLIQEHGRGVVGLLPAEESLIVIADMGRKGGAHEAALDKELITAEGVLEKGGEEGVRIRISKDGAHTLTGERPPLRTAIKGTEEEIAGTAQTEATPFVGVGPEIAVPLAEFADHPARVPDGDAVHAAIDGPMIPRGHGVALNELRFLLSSTGELSIQRRFRHGRQALTTEQVNIADFFTAGCGSTHEKQHGLRDGPVRPYDMHGIGDNVNMLGRRTEVRRNLRSGIDVYKHLMPMSHGVIRQHSHLRQVVMAKNQVSIFHYPV